MCGLGSVVREMTPSGKVGAVLKKGECLRTISEYTLLERGALEKVGTALRGEALSAFSGQVRCYEYDTRYKRRPEGCSRKEAPAGGWTHEGSCRREVAGGDGGGKGMAADGKVGAAAKEHCHEEMPHRGNRRCRPGTANRAEREESRCRVVKVARADHENSTLGGAPCQGDRTHRPGTADRVERQE